MPECTKCIAELTLSRKGGWFCEEYGSRVAEDETALAQAALGEGRGLAAVVTRDLPEPLANVGAACLAVRTGTRFEVDRVGNLVVRALAAAGPMAGGPAGADHLARGWTGAVG